MPAAFILGASRGLGRAIALEFARNGVDLALGARTLHPGELHQHGLGNGPSALGGSLDETVQACQALGVRCMAFRMDLADQQGSLESLTAANEELGGISVLVNAAVYKGPGDLQLFCNLNMTEYAKMLQCNVLTPVALFQKMLELFRQRKVPHGALLQLSSSSIHMTPKKSVEDGGWDFGYVSTKAAIAKLVEILHVEVSPPPDCDWRFFNVEPGLVITEIMKQRGLDQAYTSSFGSVAPESVASVVAHLCLGPRDVIEHHVGKSVYAPDLLNAKL